MLIIVLAGILGGLLAAETISPTMAMPLNTATDALLGTASQLTAAAIPNTWPAAEHITDITLAALPALTLIILALVARGNKLIRQIFGTTAILLALAAYTWMPPAQATLAVAVIGLIGLAVALGSKLLVTVPLALLSGALVVRTAELIVQGAPAVGRAALNMQGTPADTSVLLMATKLTLLIVGTGVAAAQWHKAL